MRDHKYNPVSEKSPEEQPVFTPSPVDPGPKLPEIGSPSILPIVPGGGNKLPEIGSPSILPIVPGGGMMPGE